MVPLMLAAPLHTMATMKKHVIQCTDVVLIDRYMYYGE